VNILQIITALWLIPLGVVVLIFSFRILYLALVEGGWPFGAACVLALLMAIFYVASYDET
jgi:hypothetical protein